MAHVIDLVAARAPVLAGVALAGDLERRLGECWELVVGGGLRRVGGGLRRVAVELFVVAVPLDTLQAMALQQRWLAGVLAAAGHAAAGSCAAAFAKGGRG